MLADTNGITLEGEEYANRELRAVEEVMGAGLSDVVDEQLVAFRGLCDQKACRLNATCSNGTVERSGPHQFAGAPDVEWTEKVTEVDVGCSRGDAGCKERISGLSSRLAEIAERSIEAAAVGSEAAARIVGRAEQRAEDQTKRLVEAAEKRGEAKRQKVYDGVRQYSKIPPSPAKS